ncbi:MAG: dihydroorotase [Clostridiales Family XIII bacterium]|jgi:dihydroorotase|nr:dihydroorotase [Clostridiales Family XIII bacterium]
MLLIRNARLYNQVKGGGLSSVLVRDGKVLSIVPEHGLPAVPEHGRLSAGTPADGQASGFPAGRDGLASRPTPADQALFEAHARAAGGVGLLSIEFAQRLDAGGLVLAPAFVDVHVHLRDPGFPDKEDIGSGGKAAAAGGFATVCCMPNTVPAIDCPETLRYIDERAEAVSPVNVFGVCALTLGQAGKKLVHFRAMDEVDTRCRRLTGHGVAALSEDGRSLLDDGLMTAALYAAKALRLPLMDHPEDHSQTGGSINEGAVSRALGQPGIPAGAESDIVARDIRLAAETGAHIHLQHISSEPCVALIRDAKRRGLPVTAETAPHYFALTEAAVLRSGANAKMNPPLRTERDRQAILTGLADGTIDMIATDHAPHEATAKSLPLTDAPFGIVGLETSFAVSHTVLVGGGWLTLEDLIDRMSANPARLIGLARGQIAPGAAADFVLLDVEGKYRIDANGFKSRSANTPFGGAAVCGRVERTIRNGETIYDRQADQSN